MYTIQEKLQIVDTNPQSAETLSFYPISFVHLQTLYRNDFIEQN